LLSLAFNISRYEAYDRVFIAYSGGIDSHVLLHLCTSNRAVKDKLTAVYIDHGLQNDSKSWGEHCRKICTDLNVNFLCLPVSAAHKSGESPEEAARNARYQAFKSLLQSGDALLVAQHQDDQLETVLLQLFRGAGLKGLSGMPEVISFGKGHLIRPLLTQSKTDIRAYALHHGLNWIEDPSNQHSRFDRNFLRNDIIPQLILRWPGLAKTVARSAQHCADSQHLIDNLSLSWLEDCFNQSDKTLALSKLRTFSGDQQKLIIRAWFDRFQLKMPSVGVINQIVNSLISAKQDANPELRFQDRFIRRYRDRLYCLDALAYNPLHQEMLWLAKQDCLQVSQNTAYRILSANDGILLSRWQSAKVIVKFRSGGETIRLPYRHGRHSLKNLYQEVGLPPWERDVMPLIYLDGELAAVGDLWVHADFYDENEGHCIRLSKIKIERKDHDEMTDVD
jgi:tRNA(Ile)-lysidine synthase